MHTKRWAVISTFGLAGLISGILTASLHAMSVLGDLSNGSLSPGLIFGVIASVPFYLLIRNNSYKIIKIIGFIATSALSYILAFYVSVLVCFVPFLHISQTPLNPIDPTILFSGGVAGTLVLLLGVSLLTPLKLSQIFLLTLMGGFLAMLGWMLGSLFNPMAGDVISWNVPYDSVYAPNFYALYIVWQTGMMITLSLYMRRQTQMIHS